MPERNVNLLLSIADHIERFPEQHEQGVWAAINNEAPTACGTAACIAGWAVINAKPHWLTAPPEDLTDYWEFSLVNNAIRAEEPDLYPGWEQVGAHLLGLTDHEADVLFDGNAHPETGTWPRALREIARGADIEEVIAR